MAPVVVPYDSPQPRRSRSTSRLSSGLQAVEHLSQDAEEVAKEVEKVSRVSERFAEDYQDAYPDAWLNQPVSSAGARSSKPRVEKSSRAAPRTSAKAPHRSTSHREDEQTTSSDDDSEVEVWSDPPSPKKQSAARRTKVSEGSQTPRRNLMGRSPPWIQSDDGYEALDTFKAALNDAQEFVDEVTVNSKEIRTLRKDLTGAVYTKKLTRRNSTTKPRSFAEEEEQHLAKLITTTRKQVLLTYHTIQALKKEFPQFTTPFSSAPQMLTKSSDYKRLQKDLKHLYSSFADALNFIEDRAAEEKKDVESGAADERLLAFMREAEPGLQQEELFKQLKDAKSHASKKGVEELRPESFARRWALENPFTEIDHSLQAIDLLENGFMTTNDVMKGTASALGRAFQRLNPTSKARRNTGRQPSHARPSTKKPKGPVKSYYDLGKSGKEDDDSDDSDASLLGPDGQLPYRVPTDNPNDVEEVEDQMEDLRRKRRLERTAVPFLVLEWLCILALYIYYFIARGTGHPNPLGNLDLGAHLGDDAWSDTTDGPIATGSMRGGMNATGSAAATSSVGELVSQSATASGMVPSATTGEVGMTAMPVSTGSVEGSVPASTGSMEGSVASATPSSSSVEPGA